MTGFIRKLLITLIIGFALAVTKPSFGLANEKFKKRFNLLVEGRYLFFDGDETTYAEWADLFGQTGTLNVEPDDNWSGKIGFGIQFSEKWDVFASYSGLRGSGKDSTLTQYPLAAQYNLLGTYSTWWWDTEAEVETTYHVVDFEAGYNFQLGSSDLRLSAGVRYTDFNQDVNTIFAYPFITLREKREVDYWGVGPRLGLQYGIPLGSSFRFIGAANGAVLFGRRDVSTSTSITVFPAGGGYAEIAYDDSETIYSLDGEVGIAYLGLLQSGKMAVVLGYRAENWFGINDTLTNPSLNSGRPYGDMNADQLFHGPFVRLNLSF